MEKAVSLYFNHFSLHSVHTALQHAASARRLEAALICIIKEFRSIDLAGGQVVHPIITTYF
jgi:hypothetical protein